jgi:hypothetical protein
VNKEKDKSTRYENKEGGVWVGNTEEVDMKMEK